jgi:hypothetical protein
MLETLSEAGNSSFARLPLYEKGITRCQAKSTTSQNFCWPHNTSAPAACCTTGGP